MSSVAEIRPSITTVASGFCISAPEEAGTVEAGWHDRGAAARRIERHGTGGRTRRLSRTYPDATAVRAAARAEHARAARVPAKLGLDLALGRATLGPDQRVTVAGFKPAINAVAWLMDEVRHELGERDFTTKLTLDTAPVG